MLRNEIKFGKKQKSAPRPFYLNELSYLRNTKDKVRPATEVIIGTDKIQVRHWFWRLSIDYANSASIHGLNQLVAPYRHRIER